MKGIIARHGYVSRRDWSKRVSKNQKKKKPARFCIECGKKMLYYHGNSLRCGNQRAKTGCAYLRFVLNNKEWKKKTKYHLKRPKELMQKYYKKYEKLHPNRKR